MVFFFNQPSNTVLAVAVDHQLDVEETNRLCWLFSNATLLSEQTLSGWYVGPRREMITPWSTNAVEITQNMGLKGIARIEEYFPVKDENATFDPMLQRLYDGVGQDCFTIDKQPDPIVYIDNLEEYNKKEGLALSPEEINYLNEVSARIGRSLTDSEVFGFSQVNSEHCRHKIFGGTFIIDGEEKPSSLFQLIKLTSKEHPGALVSAYKDNVAFNKGPVVEQFAPADPTTASEFEVKDFESVISLKAETHNFPTTVEPFNGAATGTGGEIRDRMGGGKASMPIAGTAVYITSYPRNDEKKAWENGMEARPWLYQTPEQVLIKASNGASDFGNKFGQPLICGSLLTYEFESDEKGANGTKYGFDKVIMLAGGVGYGKLRDALKGEPEPGEKVVLIGGDNYRIGMGGGAVSSVNTGKYASGIELNAVQRANPEMQKRAYNVVRALGESDNNPIVSIHDHGAGGHINCLSELIDATGGKIWMDKLPIGDPTLSAKEIAGNESQERMGFLVKDEAIDYCRKIAERERAPFYVIGEATNDMRFSFEQADGVKPIDLSLADMFGHAPKTYMRDNTVEHKYQPVVTNVADVQKYINDVLRLESVACKDWLTNKVDRSVTGKIARQQCQGVLQLPLSDCGVVALDYRGKAGIATSIGHAPAVALADAPAGSVMAIAEALTNIVFAPIKGGLQGVSLSANWMWPCRNAGEDARLYSAVQAASDFAIDLNINIPTGKDSLSMTQQYNKADGTSEKVISPGCVIISGGAEVTDVRKVVSPVVLLDKSTALYYIDFSFCEHRLGGSALAQTLNKVGDSVPTVVNPEYFADAFDAVQDAINQNLVLAGHDISAGGMLTTLLEMCFANTEGGLRINLTELAEEDIVKILFAENPGVVLQVKDTKAFEKLMEKAGVAVAKIGYPCEERSVNVRKGDYVADFDIDQLRDVWYESSHLLDRKQSGVQKADERFANYKNQPLYYQWPKGFTGKMAQYGISADRRNKTGIKAAIIREKGVNSEREMAYSMYLAGFDVKDVHITDLISGREDLKDVNLIVFCGGFSNSDVLGSAKGWAAGFLYNEKARKALQDFYARPDTLSLGICNGCQLMIELGLVGSNLDAKNPDILKAAQNPERVHMLHNDSHKFESNFINVRIPKNNSIMMGSLSGSRIGIWAAHGEGKFGLPAGKTVEDYNVVAKYGYVAYPANPNGSPDGLAGICSADGRHLAMMPHPERAMFPWQCGYYPADHKEDEVTPWIEIFVNARKWVEGLKK
ncbi:MAG: phosphoribosylformylglycinamidine synthase [Bacteroidales bacterium]|nr:phosphoribosylformylglycinamidine synthase [Bacteroidales bacterium]